MVTEENNAGLYVDSEAGQMMRIVRDHKVFWTTMPIELAGGEGRPLKVGMALALVGTDADDGVSGEGSGEPTVYDKLYELAQWLTSGDEADVRFEIRRHDNVVFYLPDDLKTKRKDYVVVIRILHGDQFNLPLDNRQLEVLGGFAKKLKDVGSPKDHWKKQPLNQI
ncbi:MAG TPA: hypothetical protein VLG45_00465 [Thermodesulfobacteriota bacterium]|nr:hypothetical protein [Thermodesulfobacteriota bacterium]